MRLILGTIAIWFIGAGCALATPRQDFEDMVTFNSLNHKILTYQRNVIVQDLSEKTRPLSLYCFGGLETNNQTLYAATSSTFSALAVDSQIYDAIDRKNANMATQVILKNQIETVQITRDQIIRIDVACSNVEEISKKTKELLSIIDEIQSLMGLLMDRLKSTE